MNTMLIADDAENSVATAVERGKSIPVATGGRKLATIMGTGLIALTLSACTTATPYQAATKVGQAGYAEQQIESNRFRVTFAGNSNTPREEVENYLLLRAAEVTLQHGFDYFVLADRDTDSKSRFYGSGYGGYGGYGGFGGFYPYYGFGYSPFFGRGYYGGYGGFGGGYGGFGGGYGGYGDDLRETKEYQAHAEILTGKGAKPADNPAAFDARDVQRNLAARARRPA